MNLQQRIQAFAKLGDTISTQLSISDENLMQVILQAERKNPWFVRDNNVKALTGICQMLTEDVLIEWTGRYSSLHSNYDKKIVGLVLAGNIPAVGFHDILCVLLAGHVAMVKLSSKDEVLIKYMLTLLVELEPAFHENILFVERLDGFQAVIATGSNNSARYFDYYFSKYQHIIRKNRTSVSVLTGNETRSDIEKLGEDLFLYFGLGCRNVSKIYVPDGYDFANFYEPLEKYNHVANHSKYSNNYEYNRAVYLLSKVEHLDNGFLILKEDSSPHSPLAVCFYEYYSNMAKVSNQLKQKAESLQCIVSSEDCFHIPATSFGEAQYPKVWDYADNVDTMQFLTCLK